MGNQSKLINRIVENVLVNRLFEALDFKNIEPYEGGESSSFKTPLGVVEINFERMLLSALSTGNNNRVVKQSHDFYEKKLRNSYPSIYNVGYALNGIDTQYAKSDYKTLIKIVYTVCVYVKKYLEAKKNDNSIFGVFIAATPKDESKNNNLSNIDPQKNMIYKHIIMNNVPDGYEVSEAKYLSRKPGFLIYKKTLPNKK